MVGSFGVEEWIIQGCKGCNRNANPCCVKETHSLTCRAQGNVREKCELVGVDILKPGFLFRARLVDCILKTTWLRILEGLQYATTANRTFHSAAKELCTTGMNAGTPTG